MSSNLKPQDNLVELIGVYGDDSTHAASAWTSTTRDITPEKRARVPKLLNMLAKDGHHCYDPETEILTENGWKYFYNLSSKDKVAAVDILTKKINFEIPQDIFVDSYNEPLYQIKGQQIDLLVTKGHRMVVSQKRNPKTGFGNEEFQTVEEVQGKTRKYLKAGINTNSNKLSEDFAKLLGFFVGDGYSTSRNSLVFHIKKDREINFLKSLSKSYDVKKNANDNYVITKDGLGEWFRKNCYSSDGSKKLPDEFLTYGNNDFNLILEGLKNSDGTKKRNTFVYYTTSEILKNQLLAFAAINSSVFTISFTQPKNEKWSKLYKLNFSKRIKPEVAFSQKNRSKTYKENWIDYSGKVYCVTVSTGAVIVKRNDKVMVSGNTPFEKSSLHFLVTTDIASHIHIIKHRIGVAVNGESARYKELKDDKFYVPNDWDEEERLTYVKFMEDAYKQYHNALERLQRKYVDEQGLNLSDARKRAKESARLYLPYGNQIQADVMFNFRSFYHFLSLRYSTHAQKEIQDIAQKMLVQVEATNKFPATLRAFELIDESGNIRAPFTNHFHLPSYENDN